MSPAPARPVTVCASPKGGQGCTTTAVILAMLAARSNQPTVLLDTRGDATAVLGVPDPPPAATVADAIAGAVDVGDGLRVATIDGDWVDAAALGVLGQLAAAGCRVIVDTGTDHDVLHRLDPLRPHRVLVTRP
jgi:Mrp family chromosome partitioning ATPase